MQTIKARRRSRTKKSSVINKNNELVTEENDFDDFFELFLKHFGQATPFFQTTNSATLQTTEKNTIINTRSDTATESDFEKAEIMQKKKTQ